MAIASDDHDPAAMKEPEIDLYARAACDHMQPEHMQPGMQPCGPSPHGTHGADLPADLDSPKDAPPVHPDA